ncbi:MAG: hypothetical protein K2I60_03520 [Oscillospiraceae bacterium]|nr:hypothetical protein [Oscillospiraceae bacterium]
MLENVIPYSAKYFMAALAMPNLNPPITNTQLALDYKQRILMAAQKHNITDFYPIMSLYLTSSLTYEELKKAKENENIIKNDFKKYIKI